MGSQKNDRWCKSNILDIRTDTLICNAQRGVLLRRKFSIFEVIASCVNSSIFMELTCICCCQELAPTVSPAHVQETYVLDFPWRVKAFLFRFSAHPLAAFTHWVELSTTLSDGIRSVSAYVSSRVCSVIQTWPHWFSERSLSTMDAFMALALPIRAVKSESTYFVSWRLICMLDLVLTALNKPLWPF